MAVNKKKREKEKGKRKRKDSPWVVGMSVRFEHCSKCSNIAKQGQIVQTAREAVRDVRTLLNSVRTFPNKDKLFEQCSNSTPLHGGLFKHCSNAWKGSITCPNTV